MDDERRLRKAVGFVSEQEKLRIDREKRRRSYRNNYRGGFRGRTRFPGSRWRERGTRSRSRSRLEEDKSFKNEEDILGTDARVSRQFPGRTIMKEGIGSGELVSFVPKRDIGLRTVSRE